MIVHSSPVSLDNVPVLKAGSHFDNGVSRSMGVEMGEEGNMLHVGAPHLGTQ